MKNGILAAVIMTALNVVPSLSFGQEQDAAERFRYGESFTPYGSCPRQLQVHEAMRALEVYLRGRGLTMTMQEMRGRFIKIYIYKQNRQIDGILLDTKTGRIRSIY